PHSVLNPSGRSHSFFLIDRWFHVHNQEIAKRPHKVEVVLKPAVVIPLWYNLLTLFAGTLQPREVFHFLHRPVLFAPIFVNTNHVVGNIQTWLPCTRLDSA